MSLAELSAAQKDELATSLAVLLCHDSEVEVSADNLNAALKASNNKVAAYFPTLFADLLSKGFSVDKFLAGPSAGGSAGAAPAAGAAGAAAAAPKVEEKEEEEEADLGGGMDMFGGGDDY